MHVIEMDRVVIATHDLDEAAARFEELLGVTFGDTVESTTDTRKGEQRLALRLSAEGVEFVTARERGNEVARFLDEHGPGVYAVSFRVADVETARAELAEKGVEPVGEVHVGDMAELFYHPRDFGGVMVLVAEYEAPHAAEVAATADPSDR